MTARLNRSWRPAATAGVRTMTVGALLAGATIQAQQSNRPINITQAWDGLIADTIPQAQVDPALVVTQAEVPRSSISAFQNKFFFNSHSEYIRRSTSFSGLPTVTGVIDAPLGEFANPDGVPFPSAFQPNSNHVYSFLNFGTRGFGADRVNTNFSARYRQDITHVDNASPSLSIINTFNRNRRLELMSGYIEVDGLGSSTRASRSKLRIGRQHIYGAELASLDGASVTVAGGPLSLTLFGGRRFTYYSNPNQRAVGGANLALQLSDTATVEYQSFFYIRGSHLVMFRKRLAPNWSLKTRFKAIGGNPVDLGGQLLFLPADGKTSLRFGYFQKLSDDDFFFDYTLDARDEDFFNRRARLLLGPQQPYGQVTVSGRRELAPRVNVGGTVVVRRLTSAVEDVGAFATSFEDYRANAQIYPWRHIEVIIEAHHRSADRRSALGVTGFDDVSRSGETRLQDLSFEVRRSYFGERLTTTFGGFYRRLDLQNRFVIIERARTAGLLAGASVNVDAKTAVFVDYNLDDDYFLFRPSIERSQVLRLGWRWRY